MTGRGRFAMVLYKPILIVGGQKMWTEQLYQNTRSMPCFTTKEIRDYR